MADSDDHEPTIDTAQADTHPELADEPRVPNFIIYTLRKP